MKIVKYITLFLFIFSCSSENVDFIPYSELEGSPILSPEKALQTFEIEKGFQIELVASEPLIHDPVAMEFDSEGNIWVIEMMGYMPNLDGTMEDVPNGSIKKLKDLDGDGTPDESITIIDSLVLPRAMKLIYGGILYAEPPNLWFSELRGETIIDKILIDSTYAIGGNVEHQPNGLMLGLDNWIYSAKSTKRYRRYQGNWLIEATEFRGQWGITQTVDGLLAYNTNSNQLRGDLIPPSSVIRNPGIRRSVSTNIEWVSDQRVYPIRPNAVNRGYSEGLLDSLGRLTSFTAASGPVIYTGGAFPSSFENNGFVPEPSGNLIKRNILTFHDLQIIGHQPGKSEFLASTDERFRPVNMYNGPDGNLYVVDMYRGVIQHISYITNYLKEHAKALNLAEPTGLGRIYKISHKKSKNLPFKFDNTKNLIESLSHQNFWVRSTAQQLLIAIGSEVEGPILTMLDISKNENQLVHGIWTLEGINKLPVNLLSISYNPRVMMHLVNATRSIITKVNSETVFTHLENLTGRSISLDAMIALALGDLVSYNKDRAFALGKTIVRNTGTVIMSEILMSSFSGYENEMKEVFGQFPNLVALITEIIKNKKPVEYTGIVGRGSQGQYNINCATCHGTDGNGIPTLGPPLIKSEWVNGEKERLIAIVLLGMEGPIEVNGISYNVPDIAPSMPGIRYTETLGNSNVTAILNYIRTHWGNDASLISTSDIQEIRIKYQTREASFRADEW